MHGLKSQPWLSLGILRYFLCPPSAMAGEGGTRCGFWSPIGKTVTRSYTLSLLECAIFRMYRQRKRSREHELSSICSRGHGQISYDSLVPCISGSLPKARGHFVCWRGVTTTSYLDISTAFRSEPAERRARPKAELQRCHNEASAQRGRDLGDELLIQGTRTDEPSSYWWRLRGWSYRRPRSRCRPKRPRRSLEGVSGPTPASRRSFHSGGTAWG